MAIMQSGNPDYKKLLQEAGGGALAGMMLGVNLGKGGQLGNGGQQGNTGTPVNKPKVVTKTVNKDNQKYVDQLNNLYAQYMNRGPFQYDLTGDLLYRQASDRYTQLGQQAMMDTMGQAAGLTGGYGNSWAQSVGNQAYQQYLTALNDQIPSYYDRAYNVWANEGDRLLQQYELASKHPGIIDALKPKTVSYTVKPKEEEKKEGGDGTVLPTLIPGLLGGMGAQIQASPLDGYIYQLLGLK